MKDSVIILFVTLCNFLYHLLYLNTGDLWDTNLSDSKQSSSCLLIGEVAIKGGMTASPCLLLVWKVSILVVSLQRWSQLTAKQLVWRHNINFKQERLSTGVEGYKCNLLFLQHFMFLECGDHFRNQNYTDRYNTIICFVYNPL